MEMPLNSIIVSTSSLVAFKCEDNAFHKMKERLGLTLEQSEHLSTVPQSVLKEVIRQMGSNPQMMSEMIQNFNQKGIVATDGEGMPDVSKILDSLNKVENDQREL